jgi:hypothetical protein
VSELEKIDDLDGLKNILKIGERALVFLVTSRSEENEAMRSVFKVLFDGFGSDLRFILIEYFGNEECTDFYGTRDTPKLYFATKEKITLKVAKTILGKKFTQDKKFTQEDIQEIIDDIKIFSTQGTFEKKAKV